MNRVYYYEKMKPFIFQQAKSILKVKPELRKLDHRGAAEYFHAGLSFKIEHFSQRYT
jgi:hypothetical protein